jgi:hypothetical protein
LKDSIVKDLAIAGCDVTYFLNVVQFKNKIIKRFTGFRNRAYPTNYMEDYHDILTKEQSLPIHGKIRGKEYYTQTTIQS